jgi:Tfp pilus assembly protein PilF
MLLLIISCCITAAIRVDLWLTTVSRDTMIQKSKIQRLRPIRVHPRSSASHWLFFLVLLSVATVLSGCSLPKIIVLHDPLSAEEHLRLGTIYDSQGKTDLAREQYRLAADQDKKNGKAWTLYGDLSLRSGDNPEAKRAYEKALDLDPVNGDLYNNLAWVSVQQGTDLQGARELVQKALELKPANRPYYLDTLGVILLKQGKASEAVAALRESVATIPAGRSGLLAEAYAHLAEASEAAGDAAAARDARERLQELNNAR